MSVFKKISVHTDTEESLTKSFCLLNWLCKTKLVTSSFSKRYVFARPHDNMKTEFSKISTLDTVFEKLRFHHRKLRLRVDGRPKRINKYAFSKISVYVWTGPKCGALKWHNLAWNSAAVVETVEIRNIFTHNTHLNDMIMKCTSEYRSRLKFLFYLWYAQISRISRTVSCTRFHSKLVDTNMQ